MKGRAAKFEFTDHQPPKGYAARANEIAVRTGTNGV
jgi:hypothetical protein